MRKLFIKLGIILVAGAGILLYAEFDMATNYEPTPAKVTKVAETCYLKKKERGVLTKTTTTTKEGPCIAVKALNETHPEYQDFDLVRVTYVEFRYRSPADGKMHRGEEKRVNRKKGKPLRSGDEVVVLAHKEKPEETLGLRTSL